MRIKKIIFLLLLLFLTADFALALKIPNLLDVQKAEGIKFSKAQLKSLEDAGFFLIVQETKAPLNPEETTTAYDEMVSEYVNIAGEPDDRARKPENAVFITADLLLHVYHKLLDRAIQDIEEETFYGAGLEMTRNIYKKVLNDYKNNSNDGTESIKKKVAAYFLVPLVILEAAEDELTAVMAQLLNYKKEVGEEVYNLAKIEIEKIMAAKVTEKSEILPKEIDEMVDYSQFVPRSHYAKNTILRGYFKAMMWYGLINFQLKDRELTRIALYITKYMRPEIKLWEKIYDPTTYFVGKSDDLTYYDYSKLMDEVYGTDPSIQEFLDDQKLDLFIQKAKRLEGPQILSAKIIFTGNAPSKEEILKGTKGFRFMGQRFIPDSYIFSSLTQGQEKADPETGQFLPSMPTALMVMAVFGSEKADTLLPGWISQNAPDSAKVIAKYLQNLKREFAAMDKKTWSQNIYWQWLYALKALLIKYDYQYPKFALTEAWRGKGLLSALGSWTELRHDTLLYAKQSGAEMGGMLEEEMPPVVKGYVEPNPEFITRLSGLNKATVGLFEKFNLLEGEKAVNYKDKFAKFTAILAFLDKLAEAEIKNAAISDEKFEKLRTIPYELQFIMAPVPYSDMIRRKDSWMGLVADVHTDHVEGKVLYEAIGRPMKLYVLIHDKNGPRLTRGLTYSYYEFIRPLAGRMTDEQWQGIIYEKKEAEPKAPEWLNELIR